MLQQDAQMRRCHDSGGERSRLTADKATKHRDRRWEGSAERFELITIPWGLEASAHWPLTYQRRW